MKCPKIWHKQNNNKGNTWIFSSVSVILQICYITNKSLIRLILVKLRTTMGDKTELKIRFPAAPGSRWCIWISRASTLSVARTTGWCALPLDSFGSKWLLVDPNYILTRPPFPLSLVWQHCIKICEMATLQLKDQNKKKCFHDFYNFSSEP